MSTDDQTGAQSDDVDSISFSATELDDIVNSAEITEESVGDDDLEEYGVWVKVGPEDVSDSPEALGGAAEESPLADLDDAEEDFLTDEEESLLGELGDAESSGPDLATGTSPASADDGGPEFATGDFELDDDDLDLDIPAVEDLVGGDGREDEIGLDTDFALDEVGAAAAGAPYEAADLGATDLGADSIDLPLSDDTSSDTGEFEDLAALEEDLRAPAAEVTTAQAVGVGSDTASLLAKMERELLAIMGEITDVKKELAELRKSGLSAETKEESTGFFDGDEDETIALTGAELDNILSSADITEEVAESTPPPETTDLDLSIDPQFDVLEPDPVAVDLQIPDLASDPEGSPEDDSLIDQDDLLTPDLLLDAEESAAEAVAAPDELFLEATEDIELDEIGLVDTPAPEQDAGDDFTLEEPDPVALAVEPSGVIIDEPMLDPVPGSVAELSLDGDESTEIEEIALEPEMADAGELGLVEELTLDEPVDEPLELLEPDTDFADDMDALTTDPLADTSADTSIEESVFSDSFESAPSPPLPAEDLEIELETDSTPTDVEDVDLNIDGDAEPLELVEEEPLELEVENHLEDPALEIQEVEEIEEIQDVPAPNTDTNPDISGDLPDEHRGQAAGAITLEGGDPAVPDDLKQDIKSVLAYLDQLLDALPEDKIEEFAQSEHFGVYKKLFEELGLED